jgi:hypothetical protein
MKSLALVTMAAALMFAGTNLAAQKARSYTGEIMDTHAPRWARMTP